MNHNSIDFFSLHLHTETSSFPLWHPQFLPYLHTATLPSVLCVVDELVLHLQRTTQKEAWLSSRSTGFASGRSSSSPPLRTSTTQHSSLRGWWTCSACEAGTLRAPSRFFLGLGLLLFGHGFGFTVGVERECVWRRRKALWKRKDFGGKAMAPMISLYLALWVPLRTLSLYCPKLRSSEGSCEQIPCPRPYSVTRRHC